VAGDIHRGLRGLLQSPGGEADALLERVGIGEYAGDRADSIPTGAARLLELARALACEPMLLLLDEPSSGLDESETEAFGELLLELACEGRGVLLVEHDMDLVMRVCHQVHVLDFGRIIASGSPATVRADSRVQEAYLGQSDAVEAPA
jgi:branched-chain amino acid transport system ATP-binding protein